MSKYTKPVEVLTFQGAGHYATIVTDGEQTRSFEWQCEKSHDSLKHAIGYLESRGYTIITDNFVDV